MNILDIGYFRAIQSLQHQEAPNSIDELISAIEKSFNELSSESLNNVFLTLQLCIGYKEEDKPNFTGSFYSKTKAMVEELLKEYDNVCTLRVRMPISSDLNNPRNFITKIAKYDKVVNIPNSMTVLDELLPISIEMAKRNCKGIWNFTNPGVISHNEILEMYRDYIDPKFKWTNFTLEEQAKVIVAPRSNNEMDASKLKKEFLELLSIRGSLIKYVFKPNKKNLTAATAI
ncbi:bifunctional dTDP-4-dehydrorhamnose 3,5-epimerase/dTDP-4-dehydrorhamnose reductase-like [Coffea arabica]|uniref:Bifunctional dTDP-4-dehydrorhamnose 3,5-epimerase/dTDP-4-dehydrorhamnose reductase-like n=1 Tax=Coffea arabica TaxID=13443 RepID=A0A6P6V8Q8_COFAR